MMKTHHRLPQFNEASMSSVDESWAALDSWSVLFNRQHRVQDAKKTKATKMQYILLS